MKEFIYEVLIPIERFSIAFYKSLEILNFGDIVEVSFRNKKYKGIILRESQTNIELKTLKRLNFNVKPSLVNFMIEFCERFYVEKSFISKCITSNLPNENKQIEKNHKQINSKKVNLNQEQQNAVNEIVNSFYSFSVFFLWGVTGSGKTEVFFDLIEKLKEDEQVLILMPEIILTNAILQRIKNRFENLNVCVWNSKSKSKKNYLQIMNGEMRVVIGARSAIFLPFKNLKLIIIDEEHDKSYQQQNYPYYHCKEAAIIRAKHENIPVLLSSATPSLDSFMKIQKKEFNVIYLKNRFNESQLPSIVIHSLPQFGLFHEKTLKSINEALSKNEQIIIYFNRRGFAPIVYCFNCYFRFCCLDCNQYPLVYHKKKSQLLCHKCKKNYKIQECSKCKSSNITLGGMGIEKLSSMIEKQFVNSKVLILSTDFSEEINRIEEVDIIVGTQLIVKGHDFSRISLVVVLNLDFMGFDYQLAESLFQNIIQLAGRSGRGKTSSKLIIQTNEESNPLIQKIANGKYEEFLREEMELRKQWNLPPFYTIYKIYKRYSLNLNSINSFGKVYDSEKHIILISNQKIPNEIFNNNRVEINPFNLK